MGDIILALAYAAAVTAQHQHEPPKAPPAKPQHQHEQPKTPPAKPQHQHDQQKPTPAQHDQHQGHDMGMGAHSGVLGPWPMTREASGTSWISDSSPMFMKMLPSAGGWDLALMGFATLNYADAGGPRGDSQIFSNSMVMVHATKNTGQGRLGLRAMASLDPFNGRRGYPNLFQTGETADGLPLQDRQHPHDLLSEIAVIYSHPLGGDMRGFVYLAPIGEPAIGNSPFAHRPSGMENPEAPISHHWFDGTHITYGVATLGVTKGDQWKFDASAFKGREPDEDRFNIDPIKLDSYSGRLTYNPNRDVSMQVSYAYLREPEALEPGVNQNRVTASVTYNKRMGDADLATTALFGRNIKRGDEDTDAFVLESSYITGDHTIFGRWENVEKDELVGVPAGVYRINKFTFGGVKNFARRDGFEFGVGGFVDFYSFPDSLEPFYGKNPVSFGLFLRVRPERMRH
jgi:hypothetical protein